jgi:hypothetical protein
MAKPWELDSHQRWVVKKLPACAKNEKPQTYFCLSQSDDTAWDHQSLFSFVPIEWVQKLHTFLQQLIFKRDMEGDATCFALGICIPSFFLY